VPRREEKMAKRKGQKRSLFLSFFLCYYKAFARGSSSSYCEIVTVWPRISRTLPPSALGSFSLSSSSKVRDARNTERLR
jgi:hypothetical protein